jgi:NAD(P)-dependent dehydrogenase (short-subunit alcohol dehydrogenase family)
MPANRSKLFQGKTALVTGATRGIGLAIAHALATEGCGIILTARNQQSLNKAARELSKYKTNLLPMTCDVRIPMAVESLFAVVRGHTDRLDILVNNAGAAHARLDVAQLPYAAWREVIETNLSGMFLMTQAALPLMRDGGVIVNNLSSAAKQPFAGSAGYVASKHGALGFTNTLREELRPRGIRVMALLPGATDTDIWNAFWADAPRQKMMSPESVAQAVIDAIKLPANTSVDELVIRPSVGTL